MRELLSIRPALAMSLNPLSEITWLVGAEHVALMRQHLCHVGLATEQPRPDAPWAFRTATTQELSLGPALARQLHGVGLASEAYLYALDRSDGQGECVVLAVDQPASPELLRVLQDAAIEAGAPRSTLIRFLPDEPSHRAGVDSMALRPFYPL
ncbi:hypothetical protein VI08_09360 [Luteibacter yeojuensis]|uniref:Uncharacterized protein n=2 Tax=Luteibacter yeojuensis TaxID=345309 RepID=A0A0F3KXE6_9GAMM|nr:hypothetical protein VI08_09360 [Luteibacter yeojuensis]